MPGCIRVGGGNAERGVEPHQKGSQRGLGGGNGRDTIKDEFAHETVCRVPKRRSIRPLAGVARIEAISSSIKARPTGRGRWLANCQQWSRFPGGADKDAMPIRAHRSTDGGHHLVQQAQIASASSCSRRLAATTSPVASSIAAWSTQVERLPEPAM